MKPQPTEEARRMPHLVTLSERSSLAVTGVTDVNTFDDTAVVAYTTLGELTVRGRHLHISRLCIETGDLTVEGELESLTYAAIPRRGGGFFGNLFR